MSEFAAHEIYARQLLNRRHGYPLWHPEPNPGRGEVSIGDVGYMINGEFWRIFNAISDETDDKNKFGVPTGYEPFRVSSLLKNTSKGVLKDLLCSYSVRSIELGAEAETAVAPVGAGLKFQCSKEHGAFLIIDQPADREVLHPSKSLIPYIKNNIENWHRLANTLDLELKKEDLIFIAGTVKTNDWGVGAFLSNGHSCEAYVQTSAGPLAQASFKMKIVKGNYANTDWRTRPADDDDDEATASSSRLTVQSDTASSIGRPSLDSRSSTRTQKDQALFLNYYQMKKRIWRLKVMRAAAGPDKRDYDNTGDGADTAVLAESSDELEPEILHDGKMYNPIGYLLDYILDYVMEDGSQVEVAIASDTHLYALFDEGVPDDIPAALEKLRPPVMFLDDERELGCVAVAEWSEEFNVEELQREWAQSTKDSGKQRDDIETRNDNESERCDPDDGELDLSRDEGQDQGKDARPALGNDAQTVVLQDHAGGVTCVAFSPDGRYIASGSEDMTIILRDGTGAGIDTLASHQESIWTLAFSPDSRRLASGASNGQALIWDIETQPSAVVAVLEGHNGVVQTISYSPDGSKIVTSSVDFSVRVWDATTGDLLRQLDDHKAVVMAVVFSPNGRWLASCAADYKAKIWDVDSGQLHRTLGEHTGVVWSIAFSPDSRRVVTGSDDTTSRIWNAETGDELVALREHHGPVWSVAFSPDGKHVMSASNDATIKICDSFSGECVHEFDRHDTLVNAAVFSPDGAYVASSAGDNTVMVWNTKTGKSEPPMVGHVDKVISLQFSPDSDRLVSCSDDGTVRIWTLPDATAQVET